MQDSLPVSQPLSVKGNVSRFQIPEIRIRCLYEPLFGLLQILFKYYFQIRQNLYNTSAKKGSIELKEEYSSQWGADQAASMHSHVFLGMPTFVY